MSLVVNRGGVSFPSPPDEYSPNYMGNLIQTLSQNDTITQKTPQDYVIYGVPNVHTPTLTVTNQRLLLISPNGTYFQVLVDDAGNLTTLNLGT